MPSMNGKTYASIGQALNHARVDKMNSREPKETGEPKPSEKGADPKAVVAAHGKATEVTIKHEGGKHTVQSKHGAHVQHASYGSPEMAHRAGAELAGFPMDQQADKESSGAGADAESNEGSALGSMGFEGGA